MRQEEFDGQNDRAEIYDRRDRKKRRDWRDKRHQDTRRQQKPSTKDVYDDADGESESDY